MEDEAVVVYHLDGVKNQMETDPVYNWREVQSRCGVLDATRRSLQAMSLSMASGSEFCTQLDAESVTDGNERTSTRTTEGGSAVLIVSGIKNVNVDLDVSIEKMTTGLRIISSRTQGRTRRAVWKETRKRRRERMAKRRGAVE